MYILLSVILDLFSDLDTYSDQGMISYDISMSNLNEVFMNLDRESTIKQGITICITYINKFTNDHISNSIYIFLRMSLRNVTHSLRSSV
jgi:hypothetical protein